MGMFEQFSKDNGFNSENDFHTLVTSIDLTSDDNVYRFKDWQDNDGSKTGLLKIIEKNKGGISEEIKR